MLEVMHAPYLFSVGLVGSIYLFFNHDMSMLTDPNSGMEKVK